MPIPLESAKSDWHNTNEKGLFQSADKKRIRLC
jgi:hypothetical protein